MSYRGQGQTFVKTMCELESHQDAIARVAQLLRESKSLLFITGAGISTESGLPTYRGIGGLYDVDTTAEGLPIEDILSGEMLSTNPDLTWKYLMQIGEACRGATFNRAHSVLAEMEEHFDRVWVVTQNVDGFHHAAGSINVIELHGDLRELTCMQCDFQERVEDDREMDTPPLCPCCHSLLRPDVVLFGEMLPTEKMDCFYEQLQVGFDMIFSIGTSAVFPYISMPIELANQAGIPTVEINPGDSEISNIVDIKLSLSAGAALEAIWRQYRAGQGSGGTLR